MVTTEVPRPVSARATLYEELGGKDAVNAAVDIFYDKMLADDRVSDYFKNTDMRKQRAHQATFMTYAFGGPNSYKGRDMTAAHAHLRPKLEEKHFNIVVEHFVATLQELGVAQEKIDAACAVVATTKDAVLAG